MVVLVAADDLPSADVDVVQPIDLAPGQDSVDSRGRHPELTCDPDRTQAFPPAKRDDLLHQIGAGPAWGTVRSRGPVLHPLGPHRGVSVAPPLRGRPRDMEIDRCVLDGPAVIDDQTHDPQSLAWGQGSVSVGHEGLLVEVCELSSSTPTQEAFLMPQATSASRHT